MKSLNMKSMNEHFKPGDIVRCQRASADFPAGHRGGERYAKNYFVTALIVRYINGFDSGMHKGFEARVLKDDAEMLPHFASYFIPLSHIKEYSLETRKTTKQQRRG